MMSAKEIVRNFGVPSLLYYLDVSPKRSPRNCILAEIMTPWYQFSQTSIV